jgi:hypothetical protein
MLLYSVEDSGRRVRNNGGMAINEGKLKKLGEKPAPVSFDPPEISHEITPV